MYTDIYIRYLLTTNIFKSYFANIFDNLKMNYFMFFTELKS